MLTVQEAVMAYIREHFDMDYVTVRSFPLFPYGQLVTDRTGAQMVVFWDIMRQRVTYRLPDDEKN
jgi:hypothetical protein